jgi:gas vesicle structural protein
MTMPVGGQVLDRPGSSGLADVVELILDRGLVIDAYARVSVIGIEIVTIEARIVVSSIDTYLRFAEAMRALSLTPREPATVPEIVEDITAGIAAGKTKGVIDGVTSKLGQLVRPGRSRRVIRLERGR